MTVPLVKSAAPKHVAYSSPKNIREMFESTRPFIVDQILPAHEVHLIGGPSGAGKTRWTTQLLQKLQAGEKIFGFQSHPTPYVYVASDRSYASMCETLRQQGIDPDTFNILPARDMESDTSQYSIPWLIALVKKHFPLAQLIVLESIATFIPGGQGKINDYHTVTKFLRQLGRLVYKEHYTIIGSHHTAKEKMESGYIMDREKLLGSGGWSGFVETIFMLNLLDASNPKSPFRRLSILPRNAPNFSVNYKFGEDGRLIEMATNEPVPIIGKGRRSTANTEMDRFFTSLDQQHQTEFQIGEILTFTAGNISRATIVRRLEELVDNGVLERTGEGRGVKYVILGTSATAAFEGILIPK